MPDTNNLDWTEITGWVIAPSMMVAFKGYRELIFDESVFDKDDTGRFVHLLAPSSRIRIRARYSLVALWKGKTLKPGDETLREKICALDVDLVQTPTTKDALVWEIEPNVDTLLVSDVIDVLAKEGASAAGLFEGGAWRSPEALKDIAEDAQAIKHELEQQLGAAGDALKWWAKYWWVPSLVIGLLALAVAVWWFFGHPLPKRRKVSEK